MNSEQGVARSLERDALAIDISGDAVWEFPALDARSALEADAAADYAPRFCELLGLEGQNVPPVAGSWLQAMDPDDLQRFRRALAEHAEAQTPRFALDVRVRSRSGESR